MRALILVLDSVGIGGAPDAALYGDDGADTLGHIAQACALGDADNTERQGPLQIPHLVELGMAEACELATGRRPPGLCYRGLVPAHFGCASEISKGKDTPSGHWEIAGFPVPFAWGYFPKRTPCFPPELVERLCEQAELPGILGDCHASGTEIIDRLGPAHIASGKPICYTSADSVFQIAAHEEAFGLRRLYEVCRIARRLIDSLNIGRVIARPFEGSTAAGFKRTARRRDFSVPPPGITILDLAEADGRDIVTIGKIGDIFAQRAVGRNLKGDGNDALFGRTLEGFGELGDGGLLFANFIDFDQVYGHRRDVVGYAAALEAFDRRLPELLDRFKPGDLLVITADHGCDPTWHGTDHTREQVPILVYGDIARHPIGRRLGFADIGASVARHLRLPERLHGIPF
jgi:phosphopentomutase